MAENKIMKEDSLSRLRQIHKLSKTYNGTKEINHQERLLELMREHVREIEELKYRGDSHFLTETGDLIVLCFELLIENNISLNTKLDECFERFEKKIAQLIKERDNS